MKVKFDWGISTFSGKARQMVFQEWFNGRLCMSRIFTYPKITPNNTKIGATGKHLSAIFGTAAAGYQTDFQLYSERNKTDNKPRDEEKLHPMPSTRPLFNKMMYAWKDSDPSHIDLETVTIADIVSDDADVRTVKRAIEAGYLPLIKKYDDLVHDIQTV